jgi:dolichol-phosphate mannosyltransferase
VTATLWICLPTYNERDNLEPMVRALGAQFQEHGLDGRVLVIDDGSPDGTGEIADRLASELDWVQVLHRTSKDGLGRAYLAGFQVALDAGAELIMEMDCDFSHDPADVHRLVAASAEADLVLGSRNVPGGGVRNWPLHRVLISKGGSLYARTILGLPVRDLTGGFKCFHRRVLEALDFEGVEAQGYTFQIELTYRAIQHGFTVREVPIVFTEREVGESKMTGSIVLEAIWRVWALRFRRRAGRGRSAGD